MGDVRMAWQAIDNPDSLLRKARDNCAVLVAGAYPSLHILIPHAMHAAVVEAGVVLPGVSGDDCEGEQGLVLPGKESTHPGAVERFVQISLQVKLSKSGVHGLAQFAIRKLRYAASIAGGVFLICFVTRGCTLVKRENNLIFRVRLQLETSIAESLVQLA